MQQEWRIYVFLAGYGPRGMFQAQAEALAERSVTEMRCAKHRENFAFREEF